MTSFLNLAATVAISNIGSKQAKDAVLWTRKNVLSMVTRAMSFNRRALLNDRSLLLFLSLSAGCMGVVIVREWLHHRQVVLLQRKHKVISSITEDVTDSNSSSAQKLKSIHENKKLKDYIWRILKICLPSLYSREGGLLIMQFVFLVTRTLITVRITKLNVSLLTRSIALASYPLWFVWGINFLGWQMCAVFVNSALKYFETLIALAIRTNLTTSLHKMYLSENNLYSAAVLHRGKVDHVDARITDDVTKFASCVSHLYGHSFKPLLEFILSIAEAAGDIGLGRPLALFAVTGTLGTILRRLSPPIGKMVAEEQKQEGKFRAAHSRLIEHAEEVSFLQGTQFEERHLNSTFDDLMDNKAWNALLLVRKSIADSVLKFQSLFIGGVFVHVPFLNLSDSSSSDRISRFRATESVLLRCGEAFSEIMLLHRDIAEAVGYTQRIGEIIEALEDNTNKIKSDGIVVTGCDNMVISFNGVTVTAPEAAGVASTRILLNNLHLSVGTGVSVIVTGPNGVGKTSMFRALAGLWPFIGEIKTPQLSDIIFTPQKPYLCFGTLRDQVTYPSHFGYDRSQDMYILDCLRKAGLSRLLKNYLLSSDSSFDESSIPNESWSLTLDTIFPEWNRVLSGGERQRVGFARLYFHRPKFAILDEATSAVNADEESMLYEHILSSGTTVFSIAHRESLRRFHTMELNIKGDGAGSWELKSL